MSRTIRVRIAVAVEPEGHWDAVGWSGAKDGSMSREALSNHDDASGAMVHWVEADIPVPEAVTVEGEVVGHTAAEALDSFDETFGSVPELGTVTPPEDP